MSQVLDHVAEGVGDDTLETSPDEPREVVSHAPSRTASSRMAPAELQQDFDYRPVPVLVPTAAVLAGCSLFAWWILPALGIALVGVVVGVVAYRKIAASDGELGGATLAMISLGVSSLVLVAGTAKHAVVIATEVPEGYRKVNFAHDISIHGIGRHRGQIALAPEVAELVDQRIFIKGYMFPMQQTRNLKSFMLVKDNQLCCFGKQVAATDMILVELPPGETFDYTTNMVSVGGVLRIEPIRVEDQENPVVYRMIGDICEKSKTIF